MCKRLFQWIWKSSGRDFGENKKGKLKQQFLISDYFNFVGEVYLFDFYNICNRNAARLQIDRHQFK